MRVFARRRVLGLLPAILALAAFPGLLRADAASQNNEGNRLFQQKRYDEALKKYTDAQASRPGAPELHYNIGNVLFRKGEFEKAIEEYRRAGAVADPRLSQAATYNRGNALMMQGRLPEAVKTYVQALRARPDDQDAKRNLELALRLMKEQQQKKPQEQQDDQQDEQKDQGSPQQKPQPQDAKQDEKKQPERRPGQMSEEEAREILDALRESEKDGVKKHARATTPDERRPEEDW